MMTLKFWLDITKARDVLIAKGLPSEVLEAMPTEPDPERWVVFLEYCRIKLLNEELKLLLEKEVASNEVLPYKLYEEAMLRVDKKIEEIYNALDEIIPGLKKTYEKLLYGEDTH